MSHFPGNYGKSAARMSHQKQGGGSWGVTANPVPAVRAQAGHRAHVSSACSFCRTVFCIFFSAPDGTFYWNSKSQIFFFFKLFKVKKH